MLDVIEPFFRASLTPPPTETGGLTPREREVVDLLSRGCTDRDIARVLGISFGTVRTHVNRVLEKTECANRAELAAFFARSN